MLNNALKLDQSQSSSSSSSSRNICDERTYFEVSLRQSSILCDVILIFSNLHDRLSQVLQPVSPLDDATTFMKKTNFLEPVQELSLQYFHRSSKICEFRQESFDLSGVTYPLSLDWFFLLPRKNRFQYF